MTATHDAAAGRSAIFLVNRSQTDVAACVVDVSAFGKTTLTEAHTLSDADVYAANTLEDPERVKTQANSSAMISDGFLTVELPPVSWTVLVLAISGQQGATPDSLN
ncbi:alpha-L-arabinofuranosidase C-terminal domain-containing protein [Microbacterium oryzae]|nr:alpha-L-arabinofuranosidase C-terminal domain-containing protein [Microbacterium oryzae]MDN3311787.1 alpha-L-arabinofuranosidase C-terminal domain-containing protein [Microbacterium oryzae]